MLQFFNRWDHKLFEFIQVHFRSEIMDPLFLALRDKYCWIPLYIFLFFWLIFNYGKSSWKLMFIIIVTVVITDQLNSSVIKSVFKRERPCKEMYFRDQFVPVIPCSGGYSFPSSHATNHMGLASLLFFSCGSKMRKWKWLWIFWAMLVGFSQIYIGVHFPLDILFGWIEGFLIGWIMYQVLKGILKWDSELRV